MKASPLKKLPFILGLVFAALGVIFTILLVKQGNIFNIGATPSEDPEDLRITNVTDTSFTASYTTSANVLGTLNFSDSSINLDSVALDDRDQLNQTVNKYSVHSITVRGLHANTTYIFQINSGNKKYINGSSPYSVKTGETIDSEPSNQTPMSGKVLEADGKPAAGALVYLKTNGAQDLSTLTKQNGSYAIPLNNLRNKDLDEYYELPSDSILSVESKNNSSSAQASVNLGGINPVPDITLSQTYDFSATKVSATVNNNSQSSFPNLENKVISSPTPTEITPTEAVPSSISAESMSPTLTPTQSVIAQNISPSPSEEIQPTLPPTGNSSVIMGSIFGSILVVIGFILFLTTGRKIPL